MKRDLKQCMIALWNSHESTRQRADSLQSKTHEDRIAGEGFTSMTHYNLAHKFIPMPQAMTIPDAKAAVDKEWKKLETIPAWDLGKSRATLMDICHLKKCGVGTKIAEVQRQSRAPGGHCRRRFWSPRSFH